MTVPGKPAAARRFGWSCLRWRRPGNPASPRAASPNSG